MCNNLSSKLTKLYIKCIIFILPVIPKPRQQPFLFYLIVFVNFRYFLLGLFIYLYLIHNYFYVFIFIIRCERF